MWVLRWSSAYLSYLEAKGAERARARRQRADRTDELLEALGGQLMQPALAGLDDGLVIELIIAPGRLAGLPMHGEPLVGQRCVAEEVGSTVYVRRIAFRCTQ